MYFSQFLNNIIGILIRDLGMNMVLKFSKIDNNVSLGTHFQDFHVHLNIHFKHYISIHFKTFGIDKGILILERYVPTQN